MEVKAITCPKCGDTIFSRARHDLRFCSCRSIYVDGGLDYLRYGGEKAGRARVHTVEIDATKRKLYSDWNVYGKKYGIIKGDKK